MDFVKDQMSGGENTSSNNEGGGGLMGKVNNAMGGGESGERQEDGLDKGVDFAQEHVLGEGQQSNESAGEQVKDEAISDGIRSGYKEMTGDDVPIADKS